MPVRLFCVCPNPALDHTVLLPRSADGETLRSRASRTTAGGKALNVARTAMALGAETRSATCLGEVGADHFIRLAQADELLIDAVIAEGAHLRICPILADQRSRTILTTSDPAPTIDKSTWSSFVELVASLAAWADVVCVSGSFPVVDFMDPTQTLLSAILASGVVPESVWIDTSGNGLTTVLDAFTAVNLKVNLAEALDATADDSPAREAMTPRAAVEGLRNDLRGREGRTLITAGADGAAEIVGDQMTWGFSPKIRVRNPTGSGDAFMAGYICAAAGLVGGVTSALAGGLAAGSANALSWFPEVHIEDVEMLAGEVAFATSTANAPDRRPRV